MKLAGAPRELTQRKKGTTTDYVAVKRGERKTDVSRMLHISRNTLDLWLKREGETGQAEAIRNYQQGSGQKITDWERFRAFVAQHGGKTQAQLAQMWGDNVTQQNIEPSSSVCR